mgnify:FL=1
MLAGLGLALALLAAPLLNARDAAAQRFDFGAGPPVAGRQQVLPDAIYTAERGYGFEPGFPVRAVPGGITGGQGASAFFFSADVPEGNYRVTVALVGAAGDSVVTIKAELRRLMVGPLPVTAGQRLERSFIVNVRTPRIAPRDGIAAGEVKLKAPRETTQEAWAWDRRLTLEFDGTATIVAAITIEPVTVPTIFLIGDSTVCDQSREPFTSWGQMVTRFFGPGVAVANHAESGETYRDSIGRRRLDKIVSVMRPGDWLLMQFGHNDQKQIAAGTGGPFTTYREEIKRHIAAVRKAGGVPVIVSPMERRRFDADGKIAPSLADYAEAARQTAEAEGVAFIDLHAMSIRFYEALGPGRAALAFAAPRGKVDNTHHDNYGAYELAKCIVASARAQRLGFARYLSPDFGGFDPAHPDDPAHFDVPPTPLVTQLRPLGD